MKNRFIRMLSILCTIMLMTGLVSAWALAEEMAATPTDIVIPQEEEVVIPEEKEEEKAEIPEETEEITTPEEQPQVPETKEEKKEEKKEQEEEPESPVESVEVIITKSVRLGDTWEGVTRDTKLTVLKLDLDKAQTVHLIVEGKNAWVNVRKSEQSAENLRKVEADPETKRTVITWEAEAGSYLITIGPVEPNKMAKATAAIMDNKAFASWEESLASTQTEEETAEEPAEEPEKEPAEEPAEDITEEEPGAEPEEKQEEEPAEEQGEEPAEDIHGIPSEENDEEPVEETAEDLAEDITEEDPAAEQEEEPGIVAEPEEEEESESGRSIDVEITWDVPYPIVGDTAHFTATLIGYEDVEYTTQWQYSPDKETWYDIPGETGTTMDMVITKENNVVYWRIIVYVEENQED